MSKPQQIIELMEPFIKEGRLLPRSLETINNCVDDFVVIENENIIITFSNKGAIISDVKLKDYTNPVNEKVNIYGESGNFDIVINDGKNSRFNEIIFDRL